MSWLLPLALAAVSTAADPGLMRYAIPDAPVLAGVRMAAVRGSAFEKFVLAQIAGEGREFDNFVKATGFDPRKQIHEAVLSGKGGKWLVAARGVFPPETLTALARASGAEIAAEGGVEIVNAGKAAEASPIGRPMTFAFLSRTLALAGDEESVRAAVARRRTANGPAPALGRRAAKVSATYPVWFVAQEFPDAAPGNSPVSGALLKDVQMASGGLRMGEPMHLQAEVVERTPDAARALAEVLRFMTQLGEGARDAQSAPIAAALSAAQIGVAANAVRIDIPVTVEALEAILMDAGGARTSDADPRPQGSGALPRQTVP